MRLRGADHRTSGPERSLLKKLKSPAKGFVRGLLLPTERRVFQWSNDYGEGDTVPDRFETAL
jgi:hypothetical protein